MTPCRPASSGAAERDAAGSRRGYARARAGSGGRDQLGGVHVAALREAGVEVVALVGLDGARTRAAADRMGVAQVRTDPAGLRELELDLVSVATPAATHLEVIEALPDIPVLCEKPAVGLSPIRPLPARRRAAVWVNYAFAFLGGGRASCRRGRPDRDDRVSAGGVPARPARTEVPRARDVPGAGAAPLVVGGDAARAAQPGIWR